ncbi:MAG: chemotaxis protein CheX [Lachnospiraceae bacterium]|nr:chemotaxis protein CheX [Lachnospiraceae bacterium]
MHTQFFGNFLLNKGVITPEQLIEALKIQSSAHKKFGTLAIHSGYMSASEVADVYITQTHYDKRFGELAVELGYLTTEQVDKLLTLQLPNYMLLGQILVDQKIVTHIELENLITEYKSEYEIYELDMMEEQKTMVDKLLADLYLPDDLQDTQNIIAYITLLFNNLVRFIGEDFTPLNIMTLPEVPTNYCVSQMVDGTFSFLSALDMDSETAIAFAGRYVDDEFEEFDEYVSASMEDFLNLHNGLYSVNMSNDFTLELHLQPPACHENTVLATEAPCYLLPVIYSFGTVNFIFSVTSS